MSLLLTLMSAIYAPLGTGRPVMGDLVAIIRLTLQLLPRLEVTAVVMTLFRERLTNVMGLPDPTLVRPTVLRITCVSLVLTCRPSLESTSLMPRGYLNGELRPLLAFGTAMSYEPALLDPWHPETVTALQLSLSLRLAPLRCLLVRC